MIRRWVHIDVFGSVYGRSCCGILRLVRPIHTRRMRNHEISLCLGQRSMARQKVFKMLAPSHDQVQVHGLILLESWHQSFRGQYPMSWPQRKASVPMSRPTTASICWTCRQSRRLINQQATTTYCQIQWRNQASHMRPEQQRFRYCFQQETGSHLLED